MTRINYVELISLVVCCLPWRPANRREQWNKEFQKGLLRAGHRCITEILGSWTYLMKNTNPEDWTLTGCPACAHFSQRIIVVFPQFFCSNLPCLLTEGSLSGKLSCSHLCTWFCKGVFERSWSLIFSLTLCRAKRVKVTFSIYRQGFIRKLLHSDLMSFI